MRKAKGLGVVTTDAAPKAIGPYSQAITTDDLVFTAGNFYLNVLIFICCRGYFVIIIIAN